MILEQAKHLSHLSTAPSDRCTWFLNLGFSPFCTMHDHLLQHFVTFTDELNLDQVMYMHAEDLQELIVWTQSKGTMGKPFTRKDADHLFREALTEKINHSADPVRKVWYWFWRNVYYFGVTIGRRIKR